MCLFNTHHRSNSVSCTDFELEFDVVVAESFTTHNYSVKFCNIPGETVIHKVKLWHKSRRLIHFPYIQCISYFGRLIIKGSCSVLCVLLFRQQ